MKSSSLKGIIFIIISAVAFSTAGVLIKLVPWNPVALNGARSLFAIVPMYWYLRHTGRRLHVNMSIAIGAAVYAAMLVSFVAANKLTTAANAIVLQFTEPVFVILLMWLIFHKKPGRDAVFACAGVFAGILCFFYTSLDAGAMAGNLFAILSGLAYALVMMQKKFRGADFESSLLVSCALSAAIGIPFYGQESEMSLHIWFFVLLLGVVQFGLSYVFLSRGLDAVSPVTASLTSTIEPILNPILVAVFYGETIGATAVIGALLVVGSATVYNVRQAKNA